MTREGPFWDAIEGRVPLEPVGQRQQIRHEGEWYERRLYQARSPAL